MEFKWTAEKDGSLTGPWGDEGCQTWLQEEGELRDSREGSEFVLQACRCKGQS